MKKVLFVLAITALTACGASGLSEAEKAPVATDSVAKQDTLVTEGGSIGSATEEDKNINQELQK
jgi:hypothetical protein